jgi:hypothetical protein
MMDGWMDALLFEHDLIPKGSKEDMHVGWKGREMVQERERQRER